MMSSSEEEDDQDEEELLQRALEEQAQRDVRYTRPPPPSRKPPAAPPPAQRQQLNNPAPHPMEDDESEVELLSISSDDDDDDAPRAAAATAKPVDASRDADLGIEDFSDEEVEEEEPKSWSKVNEEELHRRVRAMREARAAPGLRRSTLARRATMAGGEVYPREDLIDPLGLGTIDLKSLTLISDSASPGAKAPVQDAPARDPTSREKVLYHSEKFDPKYFLARIHQRTKASDLEHGDAALKMDLQNRKQQLKLLVKENFECFVSCKNTIDDIHSKLQQIESDAEGAGTAHLTHAIQDLDEVAKRAFGPLLERQAQAERIRSVQGMLQRFRTLFNLPSAIRGHISKCEYDMAVREYKKTKSLVLPSHVSSSQTLGLPTNNALQGRILKRVFEEVEKVVQELKDMLSRCMEDPHAEFSQLENAIRLLLELDPDSDPVWQYLSMQERRIRSILEACVLEHEVQMDNLHGRLQQKVESDARWKQLQSESPKSTEVDISLFIVDQEDDATEAEIRDFINDESDALFGRLIRRLSAVIIQYVPDFWRLALSIFKGKFAKVSRPSTQKAEPKDRDHENYPFEEKPKVVVQYTSHSLDEVVAMVQGIVGSYESKVHTAFTTLAEATEMRWYMREALWELSKACAALSGKDCSPVGAVQTLTTLKMELVHQFIFKFCSLMRQKASDLVEEEDWIPVPAVERNESSYAISSLPLKLRDILNSTIEHMKEVLDKVKLEPTPPNNLATQLGQMQASLQTAFYECFLDVLELLDKKIVNMAADTLSANNKFVGLQVGVEVNNPHQKLLMVLSNIGFIKSILLPELSSKHKDVWTRERMNAKEPVVEISPTESEVVAAFSALEDKILNEYNYVKASSVGTTAASYILDDGTQWASAPPVKGIRDAAVELLHPLVAVHAEVYAGAKTFVRKVICVLFEGLIRALHTTASENLSKALNHLDVNGFCQLMLELDYLESVFSLYCTSDAKALLTSLREVLLEKVQDVGGESSESTGHNRRLTRGSEDEESVQAPPNVDDIQARADDVRAQYLPSELKRTRVNVICFQDNGESIAPPDAAKRAVVSPKGGVLESASVTQSPRAGRHRRRSSGSSFSDEPGKPFPGLPPPSPFHSEPASRFSKPRTVSRRTSTASNASSVDDDLR
ncbi:exocyst complex component SEC5A isoform X1 [Selaginella moellendorffii]|uniref:exocyst complex component SEC5A isoform X1 n=1 Tax=Selaginella moellendorffii TaxID=88036 RepID=UPI000D1C3C62|nr:exocyst complex component SEC5A isoform X1 [Selaginella moellendorffii]|eukprot:XP_024529432.1 exocyst complex component SEC5A isoform X1 [Selaginella moellendorffii]